MQNILILGAGRSSTALIDYTLIQAENYKWNVTLADIDQKAARTKVASYPRAKAVKLNIRNVSKRRNLIRKADVVVSLMPAALHPLVAKDCLSFNKHLLTASYLSKEMNSLAQEVMEKDLIFMGELGLDPGIDHMSAKSVIDDVIEKGGKMTSFRSYTGGLVAPDSDTNPWHYKFSWAPKNVVLAGQGTAQYLWNGKLKYIPYRRLFKRYKLVDVLDSGTYEMYPNRDSLLYKDIYGLEGIPTLIRGTLRHRGFCDAWSALVKLGLTDDTYPIVHAYDMTYRQLIHAFFECTDEGLEAVVAAYLHVPLEGEVMYQLRWLGLFEHVPINMKMVTPAGIMEKLLLSKWSMEPDDKDLVVMQHEFEYELDGELKKRTSALSFEGDDALNTAMSKLVGLPLGIFMKHVILGNIKVTGVNIPTQKEVYVPVLAELEEYGVKFVEKEEVLDTLA